MAVATKKKNKKRMTARSDKKSNFTKTLFDTEENSTYSDTKRIGKNLHANGIQRASEKALQHFIPSRTVGAVFPAFGVLEYDHHAHTYTLWLACPFW